MQELGKYINKSSGLDVPKHEPKPILYSYFDNKEAWVEKYIHPSGRTKDWELVIDEIEDKQIYTWPLFTDDFCDDIIKTAEDSGPWTKDRHEFYPTTDKLLTQFKMDKIYSDILNEFVYPAATHLYELEGKNWENLDFENFIAKYKATNQPSLGIHHDTSLITALANLSQVGEDFEGGGTFFKKQKITVQPPKGHVSIHPGNITHKHGARPTTGGTRYIIVSFSSFSD
jgi:hypothetical protein